MVTTTLQATGASSPFRAIRVLVVDHHQLMIDTLDAWLRSHAPDIELAAGLREVPFSAHGPDVLNDLRATVAIVGTLGPRSELLPAVQWLVGAGFHVVVLATAMDGSEASAALAAGALGYVPKAAGPLHTKYAIRAADAGQHYVHPDTAAVMTSAFPPARITLSPREQRLVQLYLGSRAMTMRGVADALGISEQTVKAHMHRIRQRYATAGTKVGNVISLRKQLRSDGWIT